MVYGSGRSTPLLIIHPGALLHMTSSLEAPPQVAIDDFGSPEAFLAAIDATVGDSVKIVVRPHPKPETVAPYKPQAKRR